MLPKPEVSVPLEQVTTCMHEAAVSWSAARLCTVQRLGAARLHGRQPVSISARRRASAKSRGGDIQVLALTMIVLVSADGKPAQQLLVTKRTAIRAVQALLGLQNVTPTSVEWLIEDGTWAAADPEGRLYELAGDLKGDGSSAKKAFSVRSVPLAAADLGICCMCWHASYPQPLLHRQPLSGLLQCHSTLLDLDS